MQCLKKSYVTVVVGQFLWLLKKESCGCRKTRIISEGNQTPSFKTSACQNQSYMLQKNAARSYVLEAR